MKKITLLFILLCSFITYAQNIDFPDTNFKAALLNVNPQDPNYGPVVTNGDGEISVQEALAIANVLTVSRADISDLTGIEYFTNMKRFFLHN